MFLWLSFSGLFIFPRQWFLLPQYHWLAQKIQGFLGKQRSSRKDLPTQFVSFKWLVDRDSHNELQTVDNSWNQA